MCFSYSPLWRTSHRHSGDTVPSVVETSNCTLLRCVEQLAICLTPHVHVRTVACGSVLIELDGRRAVASVFWFKIGHDPEPVPQTPLSQRISVGPVIKLLLFSLYPPIFYVFIVSVQMKTAEYITPVFFVLSNNLTKIYVVKIMSVNFISRKYINIFRPTMHLACDKYCSSLFRISRR